MWLTRPQPCSACVVVVPWPPPTKKQPTEQPKARPSMDGHALWQTPSCVPGTSVDVPRRTRNAYVASGPKRAPPEGRQRSLAVTSGMRQTPSRPIGAPVACLPKLRMRYSDSPSWLSLLWCRRTQLVRMAGRVAVIGRRARTAERHPQAGRVRELGESASTSPAACGGQYPEAGNRMGMSVGQSERPPAQRSVERSHQTGRLRPANL